MGNKFDLFLCSSKFILLSISFDDWPRARENQFTRHFSSPTFVLFFASLSLSVNFLVSRTTLMWIQWLTTTCINCDMILFYMGLCCCCCCAIRSVNSMRWMYARHLVGMNHTKKKYTRASMCLCAYAAFATAYDMCAVQKIRINRANEKCTRTVCDGTMCSSPHTGHSQTETAAEKHKYIWNRSNVEQIPLCAYSHACISRRSRQHIWPQSQSVWVRPTYRHLLYNS